MGDKRQYGYIVAIRAVNTTDFMTATVSKISNGILNIIATRIINEVNGVARVVYDITSKPPGTISGNRIPIFKYFNFTMLTKNHLDIKSTNNCMTRYYFCLFYD